MTEKRSLLSRLFFQEPKEEKPAKSAVPSSPAPSRTPKIEVSLADLNRPVPKNWVKLTVSIDGAQSVKEMTAFPFQIGRESSPDGIVIEDKNISRQHAVVDFQNGMLTVTDTQSRNGIRLAGEKLSPGRASPLSRGDILQIGSAEITITDHSGVDLSPAAQTEFLGHIEFEAEEKHASAPVPQASQKPKPIPSAPKLGVVPAADIEVPCSKCGAINMGEDKFCSGCGAPTAPAASAAAPAPMPFCERCGTKNVKMDRFCGSCGNKLL